MMHEGEPDPDDARNQLREEAAKWFARMRGEDAERHRPAFEAWLARGALHRSAYNRIGEIFAAGKALKETHAQSSNSRSQAGWRAATTGALAGLCVLVLAIVGWRIAGEVRRPQVQQTAGAAPSGSSLGLRRVQLPAGGSAVLDIDGLLSSPAVAGPMFSRLERGRARFSVPRGAAQTILAGPAEIISSGGSFDLWLGVDGSLKVRVFDGMLGIRPVRTAFAGPGPTSLALHAGQAARLTADGVATLPPGSSSADWPSGILEFRRAPLDDVLDEANRYASVKIVLADPRLGRLRITGRFRVDDPRVLATRLAEALSLSVDFSRAGIIVLHHREKKIRGRA